MLYNKGQGNDNSQNNLRWGIPDTLISPIQGLYQRYLLLMFTKLTEMAKFIHITIMQIIFYSIFFIKR